MGIKREVWITVAVVAFLLSWLIDNLSGPISIAVVGNPFTFLSSPLLLNHYPFTATAIMIRTVGIFVSAMVVAAFIERKYFLKAIIFLFVGTLGEFYAVQQLATGFHLTTIQWTLSIAYGSLSLIFGIGWLILMGIWAMFNKKEVPASEKSSAEEEEKSVLEPPSDKE